LLQGLRGDRRPWAHLLAKHACNWHCWSLCICRASPSTRPSVSLSQQQSLLLRARPAGDIGRLLHGAQQRGVRRANAGSATLGLYLLQMRCTNPRTHSLTHLACSLDGSRFWRLPMIRVRAGSNRHLYASGMHSAIIYVYTLPGCRECRTNTPPRTSAP